MATAEEIANNLQTYYETRAIWAAPFLSDFFLIQVQGKSNVYFFKNMN